MAESRFRPSGSLRRTQRSLGASQVGRILFISLVFPAVLLYDAWKSRSETYKHWALTAFITIYGATIAIRYSPSGEGADGVRHLNLVYDYYQGMGFQQFLADLWYSITLQETSNPGIRDPYKHVVSYFVGAVLGAPWLFFTVIAFVYGYFFSGSMLEVFRKWSPRKENYVIIAFAALFILLKNVEGVNTVRTWTGLWILVYANLRYYRTGQNRYLLLMLLPPFVHFAYFLMALPAYFVAIFGNLPRLYLVLFFLSGATTLINPGDMVDVVSSVERGAFSAEAYYREEELTFDERVEIVSASSNRWYKSVQFLGLHKWALIFFVVAISFTRLYPSLMSKVPRSLFSIGLLTVALSNSTWFFFALSNRSWVTGAIFIFSAFLMSRVELSSTERIHSQQFTSGYKLLLHLSLLLFLPFILVQLSVLLDYPSIFMFVAPFLVWLDPEMNMSIKYVLQVLLGIR